MSDLILSLDNFKHPKYFGGAWLSYRLHWSDEDLMLLSAAADLGISPDATANTLGRPPASLVAKAYDFGIRLPLKWRAFLYKPKKSKQPRLSLGYPYIFQPDDRHADLIAVNRMVSKAMPGREDVCQDVMLALWESRTSLAELKADPRALRAFVSSFRKKSFERSGYGVESMDVSLHSADSEGKSKYEDARYQRTLEDPDDQFIEDVVFGKGYERDFASRVVNEISNEEEELGVPAALWTRVEMA